MPAQYLEMLKALLGINDNSQDIILNWFLEEAAQTVLNYTNRTVLPQELYRLVVRLASEAWSIDDLLNSRADNEGGAIDSVQLAGARINYGMTDSGRKAALKAKLDNRITKIAELRQFRLLFRTKHKVV
ncbi:MAG: phage head-tail connector protein [Defluviitaleaceae bacterium]|nr:phage head-tail connector protein [Defluviitaleaceae bacterium]